MSHDPAAPSTSQTTRYSLWALLVVAALFAAVAPTLTWLEFSSGSENLLTSTVIEMHAGSPWLIPNMNGQPRVRKPPLPAWVAAGLVPRSAIAELDSPDLEFRHAAYQRLAWMMRWPPLMLSCLIVLATYELSRTLVDARFGLIACAVCASSLLLLRYGRSATTDIHLAWWVTAANLCFAKAWFRNRPWPWLALAGAAMGLGFMCKGPVVLAQSALPIAVFAAVQWVWANRLAQAEAGITGSANVLDRQSRRNFLLPAVIAVAVFIAVALPWFVYAMQTVPNAWEVFRTEVTREGATSLAADPWHTYFVIIVLLAPWTIFFVAGAAVCAVDARKSPDKLLAILLLAVPIIVMSLVKDKNERYLLPLIAPAALIAAYAILPQLRRWGELNQIERWLARLHGFMLIALVVGLPLAMAVERWMPRLGGGAYLPLSFAVGTAVAGLLLCIGAIFLWRRKPGSFVASTLVLMLGVHALFLHGYRNSMNGRSEMLAIADAIREAHPSAEVYYVDQRQSPKAMPQDLQIYLNRTVRTIYGSSQMPTPGTDRVVVMLRREGEPAPSLLGWFEFAQRPWGRRSWHALVGR